MISSSLPPTSGNKNSSVSTLKQNLNTKRKDAAKQIRVENLKTENENDYIVNVDLTKEGRENWKGDFKNKNSDALRIKKKTFESKQLKQLNEKEWNLAMETLKNETTEFGKLHMKNIDEIVEKALKNTQNVAPEIKPRAFSSSAWAKACIFIAALFLLTVLKKIIWH